jgi:hypothetical protein
MSNTDKKKLVLSSAIVGYGLWLITLRYSPLMREHRVDQSVINRELLVVEIGIVSFKIPFAPFLYYLNLYVFGR